MVLSSSLDPVLRSPMVKLVTAPGAPVVAPVVVVVLASVTPVAAVLAAVLPGAAVV